MLHKGWCPVVSVQGKAFGKEGMAGQGAGYVWWWCSRRVGAWDESTGRLVGRQIQL